MVTAGPAQAYLFADTSCAYIRPSLAPTFASLVQELFALREFQSRTINVGQQWQIEKSQMEARIAQLEAENASQRKLLHDAQNARNAPGAQAQPMCVPPPPTLLPPPAPAPAAPAVTPQNHALDAKASEASKCIVCLNANIQTCFVPCGHLCCCAKCAELFKHSSCPFCRRDVDQIIRTFNISM